MATSNARVGPQTLTDGTENVLRSGRTGELVVTELHGCYYEACYRKKLFYSYVTAQTLTASNTTYTGHLVWNGSNQSGSGVNLVMHKVNIGVSVTSASLTGIALGVGTGQTAAPTSTTAATQAGNCFIGDAAAQGLSYKAATIAVAGTPLFPLVHNTAAINTVGADFNNPIDFEGAFIFPPTTSAHLLALGAASASSAVTSAMVWEEVPV